MTSAQKKKIVYPSGAGYPFSNAIRAGDFLYVSGQIAFLGDGTLSVGSIEEQTRIVLDTIQAILERAGCSMADIIKCDCTLADARYFDAFNKIYATYFPSDPPVRTATVGELVLDARIEIDCIAYRPLE